MAFTVNGIQVAGSGKSAYLYALAGGYTGTEEDFNKALGNINNIINNGVTEEYANNAISTATNSTKQYVDSAINTAIGVAIATSY